MGRVTGLALAVTLAALVLSGGAGDRAAADGGLTEYGPWMQLGDGTMRTYAAVGAEGALEAVGVEVTGVAMASLPTSGHPIQLFPALPAAAGLAGFTFAMVDWNPMGHIPPGVYDVPHFDFHFYYADQSSLASIRPGNCPGKGEGVDCETFERAMAPVPTELVAPGYVSVGAVVPMMGNHLINVGGPEFTGQPFTHTWIYGSFDGSITFLEPMITRAYLEQRPNTCVAIPQPAAYEFDGLYPTQYCMRYQSATDRYRVSVEGFKRHNDRQGLLAAAYPAQLCRAADAPGLAGWVASDLTLVQARQAIASSAEGSRVAAVRGLYQSLLGRDPVQADCSGLRSWVDSGMGTDDIRAGIMRSAEYRARHQ